MADLRVIVRQFLGPQSMRGWRGIPWLLLVLGIVIALPQARALMAAGIGGGIVLGALLILIRHQAGPRGPRRGTPIVLFPRPVTPPSYFRGTSFCNSPS